MRVYIPVQSSGKRVLGSIAYEDKAEAEEAVQSWERHSPYNSQGGVELCGMELLRALEPKSELHAIHL